MSTIRELAERSGIDRSKVSELLDPLREKAWVKILRSSAPGPFRWVLTEEGRKILPPSTPGGYETIGGAEAQELALSARTYYLSKGWFFALARQDPELKRKVDCVAYDYERKTAAAIEIESSQHVLRDHVEHVKRHMMEISPFNEIHFWAHRGAAERIVELRSGLRSEDQIKVKVFAIEEDKLP
jgi:DNA-binding MarR family transcriptional regulator